MHCRKRVLFKNFIRKSCVIKCALTNAAQICQCSKNDRHFYKNASGNPKRGQGKSKGANINVYRAW